jgi:hypothetical protein
MVDLFVTYGDRQAIHHLDQPGVPPDRASLPRVIESTSSPWLRLEHALLASQVAPPASWAASPASVCSASHAPLNRAKKKLIRTGIESLTSFND